MKKSLMIGLGIFGFCGIVSASEPAKDNKAKGFTSLDSDKNGSLSQKEVASNDVLTKNFMNLDIDKNGSLNKKEFDALHALTQAD